MQEYLQPLINWIEPQDIAHLIQVSVATVVGLLMGYERACHNKAASYRTFSLVAAASCIFTIASGFAIGDSTVGDPARIAAQIVSGVGFIGGGIIFNGQDKTEGITTAAMIWYSASIGVLCGLGEVKFALLCYLVYVTILLLGRILHRCTS